MASEQPIVIIGAGPVGLSTALTLLQEGQKVAIYDALARGRNGSRATAIHAHTLEQLHTLGYAEELVSKGIKGQGFMSYDRTTPLLKIPFTHYLQGSTEFPFVLLIAQHEVEKFLEAKLNALGVEVHREVRLTDMGPNGTEGIKLTFENGETVQTTYVVAADGSRSTVRELAGISFNNPFTGEPYRLPHQGAIEKNAHYLTLADLLLEGSYPSTFLRDHATITVHRSGTALLIPLPLPDDIEPSNPKHLTFWRVVFDATIVHEIPPAQPDLAYIQESFNKRQDIWELPKVAEVRKASRYRVREAMASTAYKPFGNGGHILLVGDAAHVHSPVGGQGVNLGICDAISLGRMLSEHIKSEAKDAHLLEEYSKKRQTAAKEVIELSTKLFDRIGAMTALPGFARQLIGGAVDHLGFVKKNMATQISGLVNRAYD